MRIVVKDLTAEISEKVPLTVARARVCAKFRPVVWGDGARQARVEWGNRLWSTVAHLPILLTNDGHALHVLLTPL